MSESKVSSYEENRTEYLKKLLKSKTYQIKAAKELDVDENTKCRLCNTLADEWQSINDAIKALEENAELKRLLKLAVEDIDLAMGESICCICKFILCGCDDSKSCTWRHLDEAMKLIGEENE